MKPKIGTPRSLHTSTFASCGRFDALPTAHSVAMPFPPFLSTSKYGSRRVAAGFASTGQVCAQAPPTAIKSRSRPNAEIVIRDLILDSFPRRTVRAGMAGRRHTDLGDRRGDRNALQFLY